MRRDVAEGASLIEAARSHSEPGVGARGRLADWVSLQASQLGMTPELFELLSTPGVTDVLINGTDVWIDRGLGCERATCGLTTTAATRRLAVQMAAAAGKRLDDSSPLVDGFIGDTVRLHAVLPPLARGGPVISLRVLNPGGLPLETLVDRGTLTEELADTLQTLVANRVSILISGATGSGKTTLLGALLRTVPADQRIVCIEEVAELFPDHPHVVHLQERQSNVEGSGSVTLSDLIKAALRMRPDRVVLGECRGPEIREVLTAMNTGHAGGFTTVHANSVEAVPARLVALGALAGMSEQAVVRHAGNAFSVVVHVERRHGGVRQITDIGVLEPGKELRVSVAWSAQGGTYRKLAGHSALERLSSGETG